MKIRGALSDNNGEQYFDSQLKDAAVPPLRGTLVEARPACRARELLVVVPVPDAQQPAPAEIALKLDKRLAGEPKLNAELQWEGVPSAFKKEPFMLTMDADTSKIRGLTLTPCGGRR